MKVNKSVISIPALQTIIKEVFKAEEKLYQVEIWIYSKNEDH